MNDADRRGLRLPSAVALVAASMIGAGIFTTSGLSLDSLQRPGLVMLAWIVGGGIAVAGAICYGSLATRFQQSGGEYLFLSRAIHPIAGFMAGCVSLLAGFTGAIAFAAVALESYLPATLLGEWALPAGTMAIAAVVIAALLHLFRVGIGTGTQNTLVALKIGILLVFVMIAAAAWPERWEGLAATSDIELKNVSWIDFGTALMWISLSYSGFNAAVYVSGEVRQPGRTVPRALLWGTLLVALLYLALNFIFVYAPPAEKIAGKEEVAAIAAAAIGGTTLEILIRSVILVSLFTSISAMMMSGPRVYAQMAADGLFPRMFLFRGQTPRTAIVLQAMLAVAVILFFAELKDLLSYLGFSLSVSAALTACSIVVVRSREGPSAAPMPLYPLPLIVFVGGTLIAAGFAFLREPLQCALGLATILAGGGLYAVHRRARRG